MTRIVLNLNSLLFDHTRSADRLAAALTVAAGLAAIARNGGAVATCLATALLIRSRRTT